MRDKHITIAGKITEARLRKVVGKQNPVILDVGCNDGTDTLVFLRLFKKARVYCFEPDPRPRRHFKSLVRSDRAALFGLALAAEDGEAIFHVSSGRHPDPEYARHFRREWDYSGSIRKPKQHLDEHPWVRFEETIKVQTSRLDTWAASHMIGAVDFIWADVQGAEIDLINGGIEVFRRTRYFYTEYSDKELYEGQVPLEAIVASLPMFEIVDIYSNDVLLKNRDFS